MVAIRKTGLFLAWQMITGRPVSGRLSYGCMVRMSEGGRLVSGSFLSPGFILAGRLSGGLLSSGFPVRSGCVLAGCVI